MLKQTKKISNFICEEAEDISHKFSIGGMRSVKIEEEIRKNNIITVILLVINSILIFMYSADIYSKTIVAIAFLCIMCLLLYTSCMWNFHFFSEKKIIKKNAYFQTIARTGMILNMCINITFNNYNVFMIVLGILSIFDALLSVLITKKARDNSISIDSNILFEPITDWERNNCNTLSSSISLIGVVLYVVSLGIYTGATDINELIVKVMLFCIGVYKINVCFFKYYENKKKAGKKAILINCFLLIGFLQQFIGSLFERVSLYLSKYGDVNEMFVLIGIFCGIPLYNEYAKMSRRIRIVMDEVEN